MAKKRSLKLKKNVKVLFVVFIIIIAGILIAKSVYSDYKFKNSYEYKLEIHGYSSKEIKMLMKNLDNKKLDELLLSPKDDTILEILSEKYYLKKNLDAYIEYYNEHKQTKMSDVVAIINVYANYEPYEHTINADTSKDISIICNKYYSLNSEYEPQDIVEFSNKYYYGNVQSARKEAYDAFVDMWNAANENDIYLIVNSSYRNYQDQEETYNYYVDLYGQRQTDEIAARPGYSEHQSGLALDIFSKDNTSRATFEESNAYKWLSENAYKYGYILRYPHGKEYLTGYSAESWHYRYVGKDIAKYIHDNDITFDEYYAYFLDK